MGLGTLLVQAQAAPVLAKAVGQREPAKAQAPLQGAEPELAQEEAADREPDRFPGSQFKAEKATRPRPRPSPSSSRLLTA